MRAKGVPSAEPVDALDADVETAAVANEFEAPSRESEHLEAVILNIELSACFSYLAVYLCAFVSLGMNADATSDANVWIPILLHLTVIGLDVLFAIAAYSPIKRRDIENVAFTRRIAMTQRPATRAVRFAVWSCVALMWGSRRVTFGYKEHEAMHATMKRHGVNIAYAVAVMSTCLDVAGTLATYALLWPFASCRRNVRKRGACRSVSACFVRDPDRFLEWVFNECSLCNLFKA